MLPWYSENTSVIIVFGNYPEECSVVFRSGGSTSSCLNGSSVRVFMLCLQ